MVTFRYFFDSFALHFNGPIVSGSRLVHAKTMLSHRWGICATFSVEIRCAWSASSNGDGKGTKYLRHDNSSIRNHKFEGNVIRKPVFPVKHKFMFTSKNFDSDKDRHMRFGKSGSQDVYKRRPFVRKSDPTEKFQESKLVESVTVASMEHGIPNLPGLGKRQKVRPRAFKTKLRKGTEILFGTFPVLMALKVGRRDIDQIFLKDGAFGSDSASEEIIKLIHAKEIPLEVLAVSELDMLSNNRPHQGVCMVVNKLCYQDYELPKVGDAPTLSPAPQVWLVLDKIQDPMNFGAVLRSAYFLGVDKVVCTSQCCTLTPVVSKASAGSLEVLNLHLIRDIHTFVQHFRTVGWDILGTGVVDTSSEVPCQRVTDVNELQLEKNTILILGNEGEGMRENVRDVCTHIVTIPAKQTLASDFDSLNVSVAAGILLNALTRGRCVNEQQKNEAESPQG